MKASCDICNIQAESDDDIFWDISYSEDGKVTNSPHTNRIDMLMCQDCMMKWFPINYAKLLMGRKVQYPINYK